MLFTAGVLAVLLGLIHSILGEVLIFKRLREGGIIPTNGGSLLKERNVRILWASWHLVTVFGWGIGAILCWFALSASEQVVIPSFVTNAVFVTMMASSMLVLIGTKGKHPGWIILLAIAILAWVGS
jgi:hypothetical protein